MDGVIDRSDSYRKGDGFDDLAYYVRQYTAANHFPAERVIQSLCSRCGGSAFKLDLDDEEGCAERRCVDCGQTAFIGDSEEFWSNAEPGPAACPCDQEVFDIGVGFSLRPDGEVQWISVGCRCTACGILGVYVDWSIDYSPTDQLLSAV
jgi:hypothetical protein